MHVLLLSMPDSFEHTPALSIRMPNGALASLAGNIDPHHRVAVADLVLAQSSVRRTVERLVRDIQPDVVGLSVMTFQRGTARRIISLVRSIKPDVRVVVGGYDPSLAPEAWTHADLGVDFIVHPKLPRIARLFVEVPDNHIWLTRSAPVSFLRWEGPLAEPGDPISRIDLLPGGPSEAAAPAGTTGRRN